MPVQKMQENIYWIGALDWTGAFFDELIPLPGWVQCYNAYLSLKEKKKPHELMYC